MTVFCSEPSVSEGLASIFIPMCNCAFEELQLFGVIILPLSRFEHIRISAGPTAIAVLEAWEKLPDLECPSSWRPPPVAGFQGSQGIRLSSIEPWRPVSSAVLLPDKFLSQEKTLQTIQIVAQMVLMGISLQQSYPTSEMVIQQGHVEP